jgi:hypothetical protein
MDPVTVSVQLTPEDIIQARKLDRLRRTWVGRHAGAFLILSALALTVVFMFIYGPEWFHFAMFTAVGLLGLTIIVDRVWVTTSARRAYRNDPALNRPFTIEITDFGVQTSGSSALGSLRWTDLERWAQGELLYLIYAPDGTYRVVPKRFMSDTTLLGEILREKLGPAT